MYELVKEVLEEDEVWLEFYGESGGHRCGFGCGLEW